MITRCTMIGTALALTLGTVAQAGQIELTGIVRDFKRGDQSGGHPDFQTAGAMSRFGHVLNLVTYDLSEDKKPIYHPTRPSKDTMQSAQSFAQWYTDVPGVNVSAPLTIVLDNGMQGHGGVYTFQSNSFFPLDGQMLGNQGLNHNFHFTYELHTEFTYQPGQKFTFIGDDDVWVYINGKRVIDLGGVHAAVTGSVLLFAGRAWVENNHFVTGGIVQAASSSMASTMATHWSRLGMSGSCPIVQGSKYIDLGLLPSGAAEVRAQFLSATSVKCYSTQSLKSVVIAFNDGTSQKFDNLSGYNITLSGTGAYQGKTIIGVWIKSGTAGAAGSEQGQFVASDGSGVLDCTLDFFFAERHTTESNFRIDTSMLLKAVPPTSVSPLYD